ncbi:MAG: hypothetical protein QXN37_04170 [Candidatus Anstonellaceae archaeon]
MANVYKAYMKITFAALALVVLLGAATAALLIEKQTKTFQAGTCYMQKGEPACIAAGCYWDDLNNFCIPLTPYMRCMMQGECEYCQTQQDCENSPGECYWFSPLNRCDYR